MAPSEITVESLINSFPNGFLLLNKEDEIVHWNAWLGRKTGISPDQAVGKSLFDLYPGETKISRPLKYVRTTGQPYLWSQKLHQYYLPIELPKHHISGFEYMQQEVNIVPIVDTDFISIAIRDVTSVATGEKRMKTLQQELEEASRQAQIANQSKSEFLANVSHELRTPLNSLLLLAQMLSTNDEGNLSKEQLESVEYIFRGGQDLLNIINDLLDLSKAEAGKLTVVKEPVNLEEVVASIRRQFEAVISRKGLYLKLNVCDDVPQVIQTDFQRLEQVLRNFISNAIKFTRSGGITVTIGGVDDSVEFTRRDLRETSILSFAIEDTGIGIPEDKQEKVFEAFQQVDGSASRSYGGTGLGLSISRELGALLGGEIHLRSVPGEGSCFTLYIPTGIERTSAHSEQEKTPSPETGSVVAEKGFSVLDDTSESLNCKVLLVDDDCRNTWALSLALSQKGLQVDCVDDGKKALDKLSGNTVYDIVFMDIMMPVMNGFDAIREIRQNSAFDNLIIVALTADAVRLTEEQCISAGANDYLSKPVSIEQIMQVVKKHVTAKSGGQHV